MPGAVPTAQLFKLGNARVYTSTELTTGDGWTARPFLYVNRLSDIAGPDIGQAVLQYDYGRIQGDERDLFTGGTRNGNFSQLSLNRHYVKIEILDGDGLDDVVNAVPVKTWYGKIERTDDEQSVKYDGVLKSGTQIFTAFDLKCELADVMMRSSRIETASDPITIGQGIGFNVSPVGSREKHGNRTYQVAPESSKYVFSLVPSAEDEIDVTNTPEEWRASQALKYLIHYHPPADKDGNASATWEVENDAAIDWYDIRIPREGRSFLDVLNDLVDRRRLVGYVLECDEDDDASTFTITIKVFTFTDTEITMSARGSVLPANSDVVTLTAHTSPVAQSLILSDVAAHRADKVIVEGAPITSTMTLQFNETSGEEEIESGWSPDQQTDYDTAAGADENENTIYRQKDEFEDVYSRFVLSDTWDQIAKRVSDDAEYFVVIRVEDIPETLSDELIDGLFDATGESEAGPWWHRGHRFLRLLAIKNDTSQEYRSPFVLFQDNTTATEYLYAEKLNLPHSPQYEFGVHVLLLQDRPGLRLRVSKAGGQQLIASGVFSGVGATPSAVDPSQSEAVDYREMLVTVTMEWDDLVSVEKIIDDTRTVMRTQYIRISGSRLDFELPGCVTDIDDDGTLIESTGRVLRDDRERMSNVADAAAEWYGTDRKAMRLVYGDIVPIASVGQFVTDVAIAGTTEAVNTPITGIAYDFVDGTVSIETSYAAADFSS